MSLNYSIKEVKRRRRQLRWEIAEDKLRKWYRYLLPITIAWTLFGILVGIIIKAR